jgi:hypothetical protein
MSRQHILHLTCRSPDRRTSKPAGAPRRGRSVACGFCGWTRAGWKNEVSFRRLRSRRARRAGPVSLMRPGSATAPGSISASSALKTSRAESRCCCWYPEARSFQASFLPPASARPTQPSSVSTLPTQEATQATRRTRTRGPAPPATRVRILPAVAADALDGVNHCVQTTKGSTKRVNGTRTSDGRNRPAKILNRPGFSGGSIW